VRKVRSGSPDLVYRKSSMVPPPPLSRPFLFSVVPQLSDCSDDRQPHGLFFFPCFKGSPGLPSSFKMPFVPRNPNHLSIEREFPANFTLFCEIFPPLSGLGLHVLLVRTLLLPFASSVEKCCYPPTAPHCLTFPPSCAPPILFIAGSRVVDLLLLLFFPRPCNR